MRRELRQPVVDEPHHYVSQAETPPIAEEAAVAAADLVGEPEALDRQAVGPGEFIGDRLRLAAEVADLDREVEVVRRVRLVLTLCLGRLDDRETLHDLEAELRQPLAERDRVGVALVNRPRVFNELAIRRGDRRVVATAAVDGL